MKSFLVEDYSGLTKIVDETIAEAKASGNENFFDMVEFRDKMEPEFVRLGFRDSENNLNARGGGWVLTIF